MSDVGPLAVGAVVWVELDPVRGHEQAGQRPAVVISTNAYNDALPHLAVVLPVTSRDRGLPQHVRLQGAGLALQTESYAMTEQPRAIDRQRIVGIAGEIDTSTLMAISGWIGDSLTTRAPWAPPRRYAQRAQRAQRAQTAGSPPGSYDLTELRSVQSAARRA